MCSASQCAPAACCHDGPMLHDRARIFVQAGAGGDGCMGFRREAHVPRGGPDGGDGGRGGDVVVVCDDSLRDLQSFKRRSHYRAGRGGHGSGSQRHGADGETLTIRVPPGTQIEGASGAGHEDGAGSEHAREEEHGEGEAGDLLGRRWELLADGQTATIARGGGGGKGNKRFTTPTRQAPRFAERGLVGEEGWLELRLRLLADVGLVGLPNAGKSSLLSRLTRAAPKVADYPFTTLSPVLGVLEGEERQLIVADIPGLIEGASDGAGLGHDFLAHVERTRLLVHVLDIAPEIGMGEQADAVANHATIERELAAHDERLARLPRVLALSKGDLVPDERAREALAEWQRRLGEDVPVIVTSSATGAGVRELAELLLRLVPEAAPPPEERSEGRASGGEQEARGAHGLQAHRRAARLHRRTARSRLVRGERPRDRAAARPLRRREPRRARLPRGPPAPDRSARRAHPRGVRRRRRPGDRGRGVRAGHGVVTSPADAWTRTRATDRLRCVAPMRRVVIKLGSSVVADNEGTPRMDVLASVCDQLAGLHRGGDGGDRRHQWGDRAGDARDELPQRPTTIGALQAASAVGQGKLYRIYDELLRERGVTSAQVLLTFFDMSARTHYLNARQTLSTLLEWRVLPVINENDTTATDEISFGDNDFLAAQVAVLIGADELILLTDIDGLFTADPRLHPDAHIVAEVSDFAALDDLEIGHTTSPLGSGGMRSKVVAAEMATAAGIPTVICNGVRAQALAAVLAGEREGTRFAAREARYSSFKLWLKYAKPSRGTLVIDAGAVRAVRDGSASLLPVGVVEVLGDFDAGDAVDIAERPDGEDTRSHTLAKGICNYTAVELRRVIGLKSDAVREILPRATDEAVHRDYLVLD